MRQTMASTILFPVGRSISSDQSLMIARTDAEAAYRDLSSYRISIALEDGVWQVDYELKESDAQGGGPHYLIDARTGQIISKRYEQ
ncbi:MAG TPA: hypothetical protein VK137_15890 [Planctomycetaceae bacterium]|nr:hypothetical protein [Planctomycetaceae bacterium]